MVEGAEVVVVAVDDDRGFANSAGLEPVRRFSANGLGEAEGEEADGSHEQTD